MIFELNVRIEKQTPKTNPKIMNIPQYIPQYIRSIAVTATVILCSVTTAKAATTRVEFDGNVMPSGWTYDLSSRALVSGTYFPIQFASNYVAFKTVGSQSIVECSASDYDTTSTTKYGGGVKTSDLVFTRGVLQGSFRMIDPAGSTDATVIQKAIARTQASFWCIGVIGSLDYNTEIDVFEAAGGNRNQANHIEWTQDGATPNSPGGPTIQLYYYQVVQTNATPWTAFATLTSWGTWKVDNTSSTQAVFTGGGKTLTATNIRAATAPMRVFVHNKPWRWTNPTGGVKAGSGKSATLQCDWVEWTQ